MTALREPLRQANQIAAIRGERIAGESVLQPDRVDEGVD
jgi:hypothetical protein